MNDFSDAKGRLPAEVVSNSRPRLAGRADARRSLPVLETRLPIFEFVLLLVAVALGWAAYDTYVVLNQPKNEPDPAHETQDIPEILKLHSLMDVKERYAALADQLESGVAEMRESLLIFLRDKDRGEIGRYLRKTEAMDVWLHKQEENLDLHKHELLRSWLASLSNAKGAAPSNAIALNLDLLLAHAEKAFSNYIATVPIAVGKPLTTDVVQRKLVKATEPEMDLLSVARQARDQATAIELFIAQRPGEMARQERLRVDRQGVAAFINSVKATLQPVFYALVVMLIVQCALLMVGLYRRFVVLPMRQQMIEDETTVEHQKKLDHFARLATGLAHEIRNPLTAINVRLFTLQKTLNRATGEHADAALIRNEIDRLEQILKNFLKLARPTEPKFIRLSAEPALREVCELLAPQLQRQSIDLRLDQIADTRFEADPIQLKQVLINLIQNAADAIGRKGTIILRARQDEVRIAGRPTRSVVLEVEDTGTGIPPEVQERLFDPFFSTKENGTGLGLPIAAKIIDQHNGLLNFDTKEGHGTTFRVILPVAA